MALKLETERLYILIGKNTRERTLDSALRYALQAGARPVQWKVQNQFLENAAQCYQYIMFSFGL